MRVAKSKKWFLFSGMPDAGIDAGIVHPSAAAPPTDGPDEEGHR